LARAREDYLWERRDMYECGILRRRQKNHKNVVVQFGLRIRPVKREILRCA
jgi:hypothetical protein